MSIRRTVIWAQAVGKTYVNNANPYLFFVVLASFTFLSLTLRHIPAPVVIPVKWGDSRPLINPLVPASSVPTTPKINKDLQDNFNGISENNMPDEALSQKAQENLAKLEEEKKNADHTVTFGDSLKGLMHDAANFISDSKKKLKEFQLKEEKKNIAKKDSIIKSNFQPKNLKKNQEENIVPVQEIQKNSSFQANKKNPIKTRGKDDSLSGSPITNIAQQFGPLILDAFTSKRGSNDQSNIVTSMGSAIMKSLSDKQNNQGSPMSLVSSVLPLLMNGNTNQGSPSSSPLINMVKQFAPLLSHGLSSSTSKSRPQSNQSKHPDRPNQKSIPKVPLNITSLAFLETTLKKMGGDPQGTSSGFLWSMARKLSSSVDNESNDEPEYPEWMVKALRNPERAQMKNDIARFYDIMDGIVPLLMPMACDKIETVGGEYNWKKNEQMSGQNVCCDSDIGPEPSRLKCDVYSFFYGDNWDFEKSMAKKGCKVWAFNPIYDAQYNDRNRNIKLFDVGLSTINEEREINGKMKSFATLPTIVNKLRHNHSQITYVKMDIATDIWPVLENIVMNTPMVLNNVQQLSLMLPTRSALENPKLYSKYSRILEQLPSLGFHIFSSTNVKIENGIFNDPLFQNKQIYLKSPLSHDDDLPS